MWTRVGEEERGKDRCLDEREREQRKPWIVPPAAAVACYSRPGEFQKRVLQTHLTSDQRKVEDFWPESRRGETGPFPGAIWLRQPALDQESDSTTTSAQ